MYSSSLLWLETFFSVHHTSQLPILIIFRLSTLPELYISRLLCQTVLEFILQFYYEKIQPRPPRCSVFW